MSSRVEKSKGNLPEIYCQEGDLYKLTKIPYDQSACLNLDEEDAKHWY